MFSRLTFLGIPFIQGAKFELFNRNLQKGPSTYDAQRRMNTLKTCKNIARVQIFHKKIKHQIRYNKTSEPYGLF